MVFHTIRCANCTATRVGRDTPAGVRPVLEGCPDCGRTEYDVLSAASSGYAESTANGPPERETS